MRLKRVVIPRVLLVAVSLATGVPAQADTPRSDAADTRTGPQLVADLDATPAHPRGTDAHDFAEMGGVLYYSAWDLAHGFELWRTDGTAAGTRLVADIQPGPGGSQPRQLTAVGATLFFVANDGRSGFGLWKSDGTAAGTVLLRGAWSDPSDFLRMTFPRQLAAFGAELLFTAADPAGMALWASDGTPAGTRRVTALPQNSLALPYEPLAVAGGTAYFKTIHLGERVLWRSDGTAAGTTQVWTGPCGINCQLMGATYVVLDGALVFQGAQASGQVGLWRTDGTVAGTTLIAPGIGAEWFTRLGSVAYFVPAASISDSRCQLWRTDGTAPGTSLVKTFSECGLTQLVAAGGRLFFASGAFRNSEWILHTSDGTPAGTVALATFAGDQPLLAGAGAGALFLARRLSDGAVLLGASDGTPQGTAVLRDDLSLSRRLFGTFVSDSASAARRHPLGLPAVLTTYGGHAYFRAELSTDRAGSPGSRSEALWRSDGTAAGTALLLSRAGRSGGSWPEQFSSGAALTGHAASVLYTTNAAAEPPRRGGDRASLMMTHAATGATGAVASWPFPPGECRLNPERCHLHRLTSVGPYVFFQRLNFSDRLELWRSDGTKAGTYPLLETTIFDSMHDFGVVGRRLVFGHEWRLWASDGTEDRTGPVAPIFAPPWPWEFGLSGDWLYFSDAVSLDRTNGRPGGWQAVAFVSAADLTDVQGMLFFNGNGGLWKSDGTAAGTVLVAATQLATRLTAVGARLFFSAWDNVHGTELWVSDGTAAGTHLALDVQPGAGSSHPDALTAAGDLLYFTADNGTHGRELWVYDTLSNGAWLVDDLNPGPASALSEGPVIVAAGDRVFFPAFSPASGVELWSHGPWLNPPPQLVADLAPGAASSNPRELAVIGDRLYFSADDGLHGQEPWFLQLPVVTTANPSGREPDRLSRER